MELDVGHPVLLPPGGGDVVRDVPESRVEILSDREELVVTWTRFDPHRDGASAHVHRRHNDLFYVLAGELTVLVGPDRVEHALRPGSVVLAPPLVVHGFRNAADEELRYLNLHAPGGGFAAYMRGEARGFDSEDPPADGGRPAADAYLGTGEVVADRPGLRVSRLVDVDEIAIEEVRCEPGVAPPPLDDGRLLSFYVLEGELAFTDGGEELRAAAGAWVQLPRAAGFALEVGGAGTVRYLVVRT